MLKVYLVCLSYLLLVTDVVRCKPDYLYNPEVGGWLKVHSIPATWEDAFLRCHYEGAVLASPLNEQLANALHAQIPQLGNGRYFFLGIHDLFSKGDFNSVEGVPLSEIKLDRIEMANSKDDCLYMYSDGLHYHIDRTFCNNTLPYVCYRKLDHQRINECGTFDNDYYPNKRTGSCYKVHLEEQTWSSAYRICAAEGGHLVIINDEAEARIVKDMFPNRTGEVNEWEQFHIGLLAWGNDRTWITIHGQKIEDVFHDWQPGQPDNYGGTQDHATFLRAGKLDDGNPNTRAKFVCEKSPDFIRFESVIPDLTTTTRSL